MASFPTIEDLLTSLLNLDSASTLTPTVLDYNHGHASTQLKYTVIPGDTALSPKQIFVKKVDTAGDLDKLLHLTDKEIMMYAQLLPELFHFLEETNPRFAEDLRSVFPKFYGYGSIGSVVHFVFEDLAISRAEPLSVGNLNSLHSTDVIVRVLRRLAQFHGALYAMKTVKQIDFQQKYPVLCTDFVTQPDNRSFLYAFFDRQYFNALAMLRVICEAYSDGHPLVTSKLTSSCNPEVVQQLMDLVPSVMGMMGSTQICQENISIPTHGDFHPLNMVVSESDIVFFDFQVPRYSSPMIDIHQYLCQAATPSQRKQHLEMFLKGYHTEFLKTCVDDLGLTGGMYASEQELVVDYHARSPWSLAISVSFTAWKYVEHKTELLERYYELLDSYRKGDDISHEEIISCIDSMVEGGGWGMVQRLVDVVNEMEELGVVGVIKKLNKF